MLACSHLRNPAMQFSSSFAACRLDANVDSYLVRLPEVASFLKQRCVFELPKRHALCTCAVSRRLPTERHRQMHDSLQLRRKTQHVCCYNVHTKFYVACVKPHVAGPACPKPSRNECILQEAHLEKPRVVEHRATVCTTPLPRFYHLAMPPLLD